jgi:hypothetical protein
MGISNKFLTSWKYWKYIGAANSKENKQEKKVAALSSPVGLAGSPTPNRLSRLSSVAGRATTPRPKKICLPTLVAVMSRFGFQINFESILDVKNLENMFWTCFLLG